MFRVLAVEQPESVVLNYAPGPLDTPMVDDLLADTKTDQGSDFLFVLLVQFILSRLLLSTYILNMVSLEGSL